MKIILYDNRDLNGGSAVQGPDWAGKSYGDCVTPVRLQECEGIHPRPMYELVPVSWDEVLKCPRWYGFTEKQARDAAGKDAEF